MNSIEVLKNDHKKLLWFLTQCKQAGINTRQGKYLFNSAKDTLIRHLKLEDYELYPILREAAKHNKELSETLDFFAGEMTEISHLLLNFFEQYQNGDKDNAFLDDFTNIISRLEDRVLKEESILYLEYSNLVAGHKNIVRDHDSVLTDIKEQYFK